MSIWINDDSKVLIQGITGRQGTFHGIRMSRYKTKIVGGVTPGKGGQTVDLDGLEAPVFDTISEACLSVSSSRQYQNPYQKIKKLRLGVLELLKLKQTRQGKLEILKLEKS